MAMSARSSRGTSTSPQARSGGTGLLVVDVGTSAVRTAVVAPDRSIAHVFRRPVLPSSPGPGLVEVDATAVARAVLDLARESVAAAGTVAGVGIANQRATAIVWDRRSGEPVRPGISWQDLRTVGTCLALQADGFRFSPNATATKLAAILDEVDPERSRADRLCAGTIDTWVAWVLSGGKVHVTDASNALVTGLVEVGGTLQWDQRALEALGIPVSILPRIVDSIGTVGVASVLDGAPPICGIAGDQQASMVGQGCTLPGLAKVTFGTGGMLDMRTAGPPVAPTRGPSGTFPVVAWQAGGQPVWAVEAMMLTAGSCVEWLRDDLGLIASSAESAAVAAGCQDTGDVWFVPALLGLGTPVWDFGARGTLLGLTRGTGRPEIVRAVLRGIAQRGADLLEAAETDGGCRVGSLRVDGGMSANPVFLQELADAIGRPVEVSPELEATTLGAGILAGLARGTWESPEAVAASWHPKATVHPTLDPSQVAARRGRWLDARARAERTVPELSGISF